MMFRRDVRTPARVSGGFLAVFMTGVAVSSVSSAATARGQQNDAAAVRRRAAAAARSAGATTVVIVRHAEKADDDPGDPSLSAEGRARAEALADALEGAGVAAIYATQFKRARETAKPLAARSGVAVQVRPVGTANASTYVRDLVREVLGRDAGKTVVIVGHSNTVGGLFPAAVLFHDLRGGEGEATSS
jgi:phosphohistidine phosphatase SixA